MHLCLSILCLHDQLLNEYSIVFHNYVCTWLNTTPSILVTCDNSGPAFLNTKVKFTFCSSSNPLVILTFKYIVVFNKVTYLLLYGKAFKRDNFHG